MSDFIKYFIYTFLTLLVGTLIYLVRSLIKHQLAIARNKENIRIIEFNKAADCFRSAFTDTIFLLRQNINTGDQYVRSIVTPHVFTSHDKAKILFEPSLPAFDLQGFNTAWENYKNCEYNYFAKLPSITSYNPANITNRKEFSQYYLTQIENLLEYAKPKI